VLLHRRFGGRPPETRTETQRDRDRVLYSSALLRLGHVTQVASPEAGHAFHSRLTHSLKVAQVARRLAERIKVLRDYEGAAKRAIAALDPDAVEAAALAHDLGHPPFGHLAEQVLNAKARSFGGFEGNAQSFRILTRLALRSVDEPGLNLTRQTLNGVQKYPTLRESENAEKWGAYDSDREYFEWVRRYTPGPDCTLEARLMDWADDLTYAIHDMDDFYRAGLIPLDRLNPGSDELEAFVAYVRRRNPERADVLDAAAGRIFSALPVTTRYEAKLDDRAVMRALGSWLITQYINAVEVVNDSDEDSGACLEIRDEREEEVAVLKELIWFYIIERPSLGILQRGQRKVIGDLFEIYVDAIDEDRRLFPRAFIERLDLAEDNEARKRLVIDLIAGMTEESAVEIHRRATGVTSGSLLASPE
jgi:dGTPase